MKKSYLSPNNITKEKEHALSLFRIPVNFFADDEIKNSSSTSNDETPKTKINSGETTSIKTNLTFEYTDSKNISISSKENSTKSSSQPTTSTATKPTSKPPTPSSPSKNESPKNQNSTQPKQPSTQNTPPQKNQSATPQSTPETKSTSNDSKNKEPETTPSHSSNKEKTSTSLHDNQKKQTTSNTANLGNNQSNNTKNEIDRLSDKYLKPQPKTTTSNNKLPSNTQNFSKPSLAKNNNIKNTLNKAKNTAKEFANGTEQATEQMGRNILNRTEQVLSTVNPRLGKAFKALNKVTENTAIGKEATKAVGCCGCGCCAGGCLLPIVALLLIFIYLINLFPWALNWIGLKEDFMGMDPEEYAQLQEASHAGFSLKDLIDEIELGVNRSYNIEDIFTAVINNKNPKNSTEDMSTYSYLQSDVDSYNSKYEDLIKEGKLPTIAEGDLTAFGLIFELLLNNYTVINLKLPSLAPQRQKDNITYVTYDPEGKHQALFEEVLNDIPALKGRFDGQLKAEWFDTNLVQVLDEKFDVYIKDMRETRELSLRDLFNETSKTSYDTEYDRDIVSAILADTTNNGEIIAQFEILQKNLASLEMMTYMLYYQKYYHQKQSIRLAFKDCVNVDMYSDEFFAQFLTFTDIEQFIALSSLTDHSFVYEIAIANLEVMSIPPTTDIIDYGNFSFGYLLQYTNWFATYNFEPDVTPPTDANASYTYEMPCTSMDKTSIQQKLFDKYNIEANFRYGTDVNDVIEKTPEENAATFFAIFELATGIPMSVGDDGVNVPIYNISADGVVVNQFNTSPVQSPNARITLPFNASYSDATVAAFGVNRIHKGIDYGVPTGTTVYATSSGTAYTNYGNTGYGNYTKILHDDGYTSIYAHGNGTFYVTNGSRVSAGQPIMQSGNSGNSTGPHLHFEVRTPSGTPINPTDYIYS